MSNLALLFTLAGLCVHVDAGVEYAVKIIPTQQGQCPSPLERQQVRNQITAEVQDIFNTCGGPSWTRVAFLDMTDPSQQCPPGLNLTSHVIRTCGSSHTADNDCSSTFFAVSGQMYGQVCGRIRGYQFGRVEGFLMRNEINQAIDDAYVNGVSLTYNNRGGRQHIWTFANGFTEILRDFPIYICPCDGGPNPAQYVGQNYFCEAGTVDGLGVEFLADDPLWDGEGCVTGTCCEFNDPPFFNTTLPAPTAADIELRICHTAPSRSHDFPIEQIELYIK